jgi:hypothetical protein
MVGIDEGNIAVRVIHQGCFIIHVGAEDVPHSRSPCLKPEDFCSDSSPGGDDGGGHSAGEARARTSTNHPY